MNIFLASASPRRAELLHQVGIPFTVIEPSIAEEMVEGVSYEEMVTRLALEKTASVSGKVESGYILAADTVVVSGSKALGKPVNTEEAGRMLRQLSGTRHLVLTGIALVNADTGASESGFAKTYVWMKTLTDEQINSYVATGEPMDKAGGYGIQGRAALFVDRVDGCYFNVVGLPLGLFFEFLVRMQVPTWFNEKGWR